MGSYRMRFTQHAVLVSSVLMLAACGGNDVDNNSATNASAPPPPPTPSFVDSAPVPDVPAFVDNIATNQRGDARFATLATNAGVRVVSRFLDLWGPTEPVVAAVVNAPAVGMFPAITQSTWTGNPMDGSFIGTIINAPVLAQNIQ